MRFLRHLLIIALVALAIWRLSPHFSDFSQLPAIAKNVNLIFIALAVLTQLGQYFGDGWLSQLLLRIVGVRINLLKTLQIASIDVFAAHVLPIGEAGVIATAYYFYRKLGVDSQSLIFLSVAWGLITNIVLVILLLLSTIFLPKAPNIPIHISQLAAWTIVILTVPTLILFLSRKFSLPKIEKLLQRFGIYKEIMIFLTNFSAHKNAIQKNKMLVAKASLAGLIYYSSNIATLAFCFLAFGSLPPLSVIAFAYFVSLLAGLITLAPAGIGATEATLIIIFHEFNVEPALSLAAIISFRLISFWLPIPAGAISYFALKRSPKPPQ